MKLKGEKRSKITSYTKIKTNLKRKEKKINVNMFSENKF